MNKEDMYGLTNPQKNIWQTEQVIEKESSINHIYALMRLRGTLDSSILEKTINKIIENNDSFRLVIKKDKNEPKQYIAKYNWVNIEQEKIDEGKVENVIENYKNVKLSNNQLYSFKLLSTQENTYVLYKSHHIIADAWGMTQVAEQIKYIYNKMKNNEEIENKSISYKSFIEREAEYEKSAKYEIDKKFWENYVKSIEKSEKFNTTNRFDKKAKRCEYKLEEGLFEKITDYCKKHKITEYAFFLGSIAVYFRKMLNLNNIVIGTPFLNRQKRFKELSATGMYVSTLPLNIEMEEEKFADLCNKIATMNFNLYKHSNFAYRNIEELYHKYSNDNSNLYDVVFSYQINKLENAMDNKDLGMCRWIFLGEQNNPLSIHLTTLNNYKLISYDYLISYFNEIEIKKMNDIINFIIKQVLSGKENIVDINIITEKDEELLKKLNDTGKIENKNENVIDILNNIVKKYETKEAIICGEKHITYKEFNDKVNNIAKILKDVGISKNTPVALFFDKSIEMIESIFAVLKAGGCYVPILPDEDEKRIQYILNDCRAKCILTHKNYKIKTDIKIIDVEEIKNEEIENINIDISNEDIAYIIYTSGSTGNPKGTMVTHKNICNLKYSIEKDEILKATDKDISISLLKYSFDASGIDIYTSILFGGTLILVEKEDELNPEKVVKIMEKNRVTRSFLIPKWIENIVIQDKLLNSNLSNLRILGTGGETLKPHILEHLLGKYKNLKVLNLYGPTETTMFTTVKVVTKKEIENNYTSIGRPIYGSRIGVINKENRLMPVNTKGELIIYEDKDSIRNISKGYLNLDKITNEKFINIYNSVINEEIKAYKTGDIVKINDNLEIEFIGRDDDVVKVNGGYLIALNEVENTIQKLLGENFKTFPVAIPYRNTKIIILFVVKNEKNISIDNIKRYINKNISFYMKPKKIIELDEFPRNSSGKVNRKKLQEIAIKYMEDNKNEVILPKTEIEEDIYNIIKKIILIDEFSIYDDFIDDLGIDSLSLTALYTNLEKYNIKIQDIYNNSNVKDLAYFIENNNIELKPNIEGIENIKILNNVKPFDLSNILLTGVTGFLGIHILKDLLYNENIKNIYCIIRNKINLTGEKRLNILIKYYFPNDNKILEKIEEKVIILDGDITKEKFGIEDEKYFDLKNKVTTVINSAANVRHFAKPRVIRKDNVESVKNIMEFCKENISLAHISTLSIVGFKEEETLEKEFDENTLYIKQGFQYNPYLISKFEAEKEILQEVNSKNLNAVIFRLGNIMPRISDGKFQKNENQNVFLKAIKAMVEAKMIPKEIMDLNLEFSPVDECSKIIVELLKKGDKSSIYHILSNREIKVSKLKEIFEKFGYELQITNINKFTEKIEEISDQYTKEYILSHNLNKYSQRLTLKSLDEINIKWSEIDEEYIKKILDIIQKF